MQLLFIKSPCFWIGQTTSTGKKKNIFFTIVGEKHKLLEVLFRNSFGPEDTFSKKHTFRQSLHAVTSSW